MDDDLRELIERARAICRAVPERGASPATEEAYLKTFGRMLRDGNLDPLKPGVAYDTYYFRRAALHVGGKRIAELLVSECMAAVEARRPDLQRRSAIKLANLLKRLEPAFALDPPSPVDGLPWDGPPSRWRQSDGAERPRGANSKRHVLAELPEDWTERLWNGTPVGWPFRDALAVHLIAPFRPEELAPGQRPSGWSPGVVIELLAPRRLAIVFTPVKSHGGEYGTERTGIVVDPQLFGGPAVHLAQLSQAAGGRITVCVGSKNTCRKALARLGKQALPEVKVNITPYVIRHQLLADLKATFGGGEEVAAAGGHCTDRTQARYGYLRQGRRRKGYIEIIARRPPRCGNVERARQFSHPNAPRPVPG